MKKTYRYCRACGGRLKQRSDHVGRPSDYCLLPKKCRQVGRQIIARRFKRRLKHTPELIKKYKIYPSQWPKVCT